MGPKRRKEVTNEDEEEKAHDTQQGDTAASIMGTVGPCEESSFAAIPLPKCGVCGGLKSVADTLWEGEALRLSECLLNLSGVDTDSARGLWVDDGITQMDVPPVFVLYSLEVG